MRSGGVRSARIEWASGISCSGAAKLRAKRITPPTCGCWSRSMSSGVSSMPPTSTMTGPKRMGARSEVRGTRSFAFQHDEGHRNVAVVGQRDVRIRHAHFLQMFRHRGARLDAGLAARVSSDRDALPCERGMDSRPDRLRKRFLGCESFREMPRLVLHPGESGPLGGREDPVDQSIAEPIEALLDTLDRAHIRSDADDHLLPRASYLGPSPL